ncbi:MAG: hypothetical protein J6N32_08215, partial [Clostridia bacterium]|nr:hypothetical protein [Clostridia bacterium]
MDKFQKIKNIIVEDNMKTKRFLSLLIFAMLTAQCMSMQAGAEGSTDAPDIETFYSYSMAASENEDGYDYKINRDGTTAVITGYTGTATVL